MPQDCPLPYRTQQWCSRVWSTALCTARLGAAALGWEQGWHWATAATQPLLQQLPAAVPAASASPAFDPGFKKCYKSKLVFLTEVVWLPQHHQILSCSCEDLQDLHCSLAARTASQQAERSSEPQPGIVMVDVPRPFSLKKSQFFFFFF